LVVSTLTEASSSARRRRPRVSVHSLQEAGEGCCRRTIWLLFLPEGSAERTGERPVCRLVPKCK